MTITVTWRIAMPSPARRSRSTYLAETPAMIPFPVKPVYKVRCTGINPDNPACGWTGYRTGNCPCLTAPTWRLHCRPTSPCPHCNGDVTGRPRQPRRTP